jgi:hypothetical protein
MGSTGGGIGYHLTAAGVALISTKSLGFAFFPLLAAEGIPMHIITKVRICPLLMLQKMPDIIFRFTEGTFHFLRFAVECNGTVTIGALKNLNLTQNNPLLPKIVISFWMILFYRTLSKK